MPSLAKDLELALRYQSETSPGSGRYHRLHRKENWIPSETAIVVCDVWDLHHCLNAVRRLEEFAPRLDEVLVEARKRGVTIIHSPSDCMAAYADHTARKRAIDTPTASKQPKDIAAWCSRIPEEEKAAYPIDQSDGGEDDDPEEHAAWVAKLKSLGRNPGTPWKRQSDMITIDAERDYISDRGNEVWNILEHHGIKNVILTGVHTNMCVLGRPFGLRQMARNGKNVALLRDMTDTMYNPQRWPYVSHYTGTDLIVSHVEKFVCPTITSDQILGGKPFEFKHDRRPHLAIVMAEKGYHTNQTLPDFASKYLGKHFRVSYVFADDKDRNSLPGLEVLDEADVVLLSVRRRVLPKQQMDIVRRFVRAAKPVVGIRTSSHAFALNNQSPPKGFDDWATFDREVFGCSYHGDYGNKVKSTVHVPGNTATNPILTGISKRPFAPGYSLYKLLPLADRADLLFSGKIDGQQSEPVTWTFYRADGGRSFYTSLGHSADFENPILIRMLLNGIHWAAGIPVRKEFAMTSPRQGYKDHWSIMPVPSSWAAGSAGILKDHVGVSWYRCVVRIPSEWIAKGGLVLKLPGKTTSARVWFNGHQTSRTHHEFAVPSVWVEADEANLIVVRIDDARDGNGILRTPVLTSAKGRLELKGRWQFRIGENRSWTNMPLPAKFGTPTDIVFEP